ncbi:MAG: hypothetical protein ACI8YQ_003526 [Polaribacter sp.]|jgi:hypothetical protein
MEKIMSIKYLVLLLFLTLSLEPYAQSPYEVNWKKEIKLKEKGLTFQVEVNSLYFSWGFSKNKKEAMTAFFE